MMGTNSYNLFVIALAAILLTGEPFTTNITAEIEAPNSHTSLLKHEKGEDGNHSMVCQTAACRYLSESIRKSIDPGQNPCEDFYKFSCGKHLTEEFYNVIFGMFLNNSGTMMEILGYTPFKQEEQNATDKVIMAYHLCVNESFDIEKQVALVHDFLERVGVDVWPEIPEATGKGSWQELWADFYYNLNTNAFFKLLVMIHPDDSSKLIYTVLIGENGIGGPFTDSNGTFLEWDVIKSLYVSYVKGVMSLFTPAMTDEDLSKLATDVATLQFTLTEMTTLAEDDTDPEKWRRTTFGQAIKDMPQMDALNQLFKRGNVTLKEHDEVILRGVHYLVKLQDILDRTPKHIVRNFLVWNALQHIAENVSNPFGRVLCLYRNTTPCPESSFKFLGIVNCMERIEALGAPATARLYAEHHFTPAQKEKVEEIVHQLKNMISEEISSSAWLDEDTKAHFLNKLKKMTATVGYPSWIFNDTALNNLFSSVGEFTPQTSFLEIHVAFTRLLIHETLNAVSLNESFSSDQYRGSTIVVNAYYLPDANMININLGLLKQPIFDADLPWFINLATLGLFIGHEISHAFDIYNVAYGIEGKPYTKLSENTKNIYLDKGKCYMEQYGTGGNISHGKKGFKGSISLGEDMADNMAERMLLKIINEKKREDLSRVDLQLPDLLEYSSDQLFFIAQAIIRCETPGFLEIAKGPHSDTWKRINITFSNIPEFSEAFGCPLGSPMNPSDKCTFW